MNLEEMRQYKVRWIMRFSVPAIIAMLLSAVVTVTDGYFTGNYVGKDALAAVNLGLPIVYLMLSCGLMVGVGGSVIAGILNGGGQKEKCRQVFNQTAATAFLVSATVSLLLWIFFEAVKRFLGVNEGLVFYFTEYYRVMLFYYPVMVLNSVFSMFIRAEGKPQYGMAVTVIGVVVNVFLNAAFIRLGLGICGIALASVVSGLVSLTLSFLFFVRYARICRFVAFSFDGRVLRDTILNGSSEFVGEMASCISLFCYNRVILRLTGAEGVSAFAIAGYTIFVFSMIVIGFGQGMSPLVSFACGAGDDALADDFRKRTGRIVFCAGVCFSAVMLLGLEPYSSLFVKDEAVKNMVKEAIPFLVIAFLLMGFNIIASVYLTSCGRALPSAVISIARGIVILLICIFTLPMIFGMRGIWLAGPVTEMLSGILTAACLHRNARTAGAV